VKVAVDSMAVRPVRRSEETRGGPRSRRRAWPARQSEETTWRSRRPPLEERRSESQGSASTVLGGEPVEVAAIASCGGAQRQKTGARPARWSEENPWRSRSSPAVEERMARLRTING
jgi:hypothetical protein